MDNGVRKRLASAALATMLAAPALGEGLSGPRLIGVVIGPQTREAVLVDGGRLTVAREGATFGGYRVKIVDSETVLLVGPSDNLTLRFGAEADPHGQPADFPQPEPANRGEAVGRLAIGRDECARAGLLPGVRADTETRLRELIDTVANLPGGGAGQIARLAPSQFNAAGMSAGLAGGLGQPAEIAPDRAECAALEARWKRAAGRWGLL